jgi:hypothetical protein
VPVTDCEKGQIIVVAALLAWWLENVVSQSKTVLPHEFLLPVVMCQKG